MYLPKYAYVKKTYTHTHMIIYVKANALKARWSC